MMDIVVRINATLRATFQLESIIFAKFFKVFKDLKLKLPCSDTSGRTSSFHPHI